MAVVVEVGSILELGEAELAKWREWQRAQYVLTNPFLSPEFAQAKARHLKNQRLAILRDGNDIIGFAPYEQVGRHTGITRAVIADPQSHWSIRDLLVGTNLDVIEYPDLPLELQESFEARGAVLHPVATIDLSVGWDVWSKDKMSSSRVKRFFRKGRNIERDLGEVEFKLHNPSHDALNQLMKWKSDHNDRTGHFNRYADPVYRAMVHDMLDQPNTENFGLYLTTYEAGGRMLALQLDMVANNYCGAWQTTHDPDPELDRYSAGMVMMLRLYEGLAAEGVHTVDMGVGPSLYKDVMKNHEIHVVEGWSERPSFGAYGRRMKRAPKRFATHMVQSNPRLSKAARKAMHQVHGTKQKLLKG